MSLKYALFDLDDTLYPRNAVMPAIGENIKHFLMRTLDLSYQDASQKRLYYNETYGTVLRGLLQEESVNIEEYLEYVHNVPVTELLQPNQMLDSVLANIPLKKYIFTNSYHTHAENVMAVLGVRHHFDGIFDIKSVDYVSKPARHAYVTVVETLDTTPGACIYIDDKSVNLREPKKMGMRTILVDAEPDEWVDIAIKDILEVDEVIVNFLSESG